MTTARPIPSLLSRPGGGAPPEGVRLTDLLALEQVDDDLFRTTATLDEPFSLYGGQVAAQALTAAGRTVAADRPPHSLHGYFLRAGDAGRPTAFRVHRERDGRSYSARRVVATQDGETVFTLSASFHTGEDGRDLTFSPAPDAAPADGLPAVRLPRLVSVEAREPVQPYPDSVWPTRFWARCTAPLGDDPLVHAAALTYLSDVLSGLAPFRDADGAPMSSLDHAVWFHRPARMDAWTLLDLVPRTVASGRGWYTGTLTAADGSLCASLTQEQLFRRRRPDHGAPGTA